MINRPVYIEKFVKIDTQLNIEATVDHILQVRSLHSRNITEANTPRL